MPPPVRTRPRPEAVAVAVAVALVAAIGLLLRADSGRGQGPNRIVAPPAALARPHPAAAPGACAASGSRPRFQAATTRRVVALTFDDGPDRVTPRVLSLLHRAGQRATFFVVGRQIAGYEPTLRAMTRDGDAIGNHTWDHADVSAGDAAAAGELLWTSRAVRHATGRQPCVMRAPYGRTSPALVATAARQGMVVTEWNVDPQDWRSSSAAQTARAVLSALRPGAIVILHDGGPRARETLAALPRILRGLARRGYRSITVPQLLHLRRAR
ncbi:MAG: polysaccharide deacetylase family protein [Solirubrobacteraceae bacterium]